MCPQEDIEEADTASDSEIVRYEKAFLATRRTLSEAIRNLSVLLEFEEESSRRNQLGASIAELIGELDDLSRASIAFHTHIAIMVPPSAKQVAELISLANRATQLTVQRATAVASLRIATSALNKFAKIQDIGAVESAEEANEDEGGAQEARN